jgi:hypothetical protein
VRATPGEKPSDGPATTSPNIAHNVAAAATIRR